MQPAPMRLPTWDEIVNVGEQRDVMEHPLDRSLFVVGPPGSGKTILAVHRAQMVAAFTEGEAQHPVSIVTFNRMLRRLLDIIREREVSVSTMHSFVWNDFRNRTNRWPAHLPHDSYAPDWDSIFSSLDEAEEVLERKHLVIDEGQDLPEEFFRYGSRYVASTLSVFADEDQALSGKRTTLEKIKAAAGLDDPVILTKNHRNTPEIARLAEHFHSGRLPAAAVVRPSLEELPRLIRSGDQILSPLPVSWQTGSGTEAGVSASSSRGMIPVNWSATCLSNGYQKGVSIFTTARKRTKMRLICSSLE